MRELAHYKDKLKSRKYIQTKHLTARGDIKAGDIIKRFGYDSFYIVNITDDDLSVKSYLGEGDIISAIEKYGFSVSLAEICEVQENFIFDNNALKKI